MNKKFLDSLMIIGILITSSLFAAGVTTNKVPTNTLNLPSVDTQKNSIKGLVILNDYFARDEINVYRIHDDRTGWTRIENADRETFKIILGRFAQDKAHIYFLGNILENVDRESFVVISGTHGYASDDKTIYGPQGAIEGSDPETFKLFTGRYGADAGQVYYMGKKIDADSATFQVLDAGSYALDAEKVFYNGKILRGVPVDGFAVKGERAFASDGHVFFEGRVERGDPLPEDEDISAPTEEIPTAEGEAPIPEVRETLMQKLFSIDSVLIPYKMILQMEWPFFIFLGLAVVAFFSALFVFFAERNDTTASWVKTFFKTVIALLVGAVIFWLSTYWFPISISGFIGGLIGVIAFLSLSNLGGKLKTLFVALLASIAFGFFVSVATIVFRVLDSTPYAILHFITQDIFQISMVLGSIGIFFGAWLIRTQLKVSSFGAILAAIISTIASLLILFFVYWLGPISYFSMTILFTLLFGAFVWVLSFRLNAALLLTSIRVLRVSIILGLISIILVWFIV